MISSTLFRFLQWKTKLETLLNFGIHVIDIKDYRIIDYKKLVTNQLQLRQISDLLQEKPL